MTESCRSCLSDEGLLPAGDDGITRSWANTSCSIYCLADFNIVKEVQKTLLRMKIKSTQDNEPFFIAAGFKRPAASMLVSKDSFDLYDQDSQDLATNPYPPQPSKAVSSNGALEIGFRPDIEPYFNETSKWREVPLEKHPELRRAYKASVSFIDDQIGIILSTLEKLKLKDSTMVVLFGSQGWHLGEQGTFGKETLYDTSTRVPLIFSIPGQRSGAKTKQIVELVDIFPTLIDFAELPKLNQCQGKSLRMFIQDPENTFDYGFAFSELQKSSSIGLTIRFMDWRYTEFMDFDYHTYRPKFGTTFWKELYDHRNDPKGNLFETETINLAYDSSYSNQMELMSSFLKQRWPMDDFTYTPLQDDDSSDDSGTSVGWLFLMLAIAAVCAGCVYIYMNSNNNYYSFESKSPFENMMFPYRGGRQSMDRPTESPSTRMTLNINSTPVPSITPSPNPGYDPFGNPMRSKSPRFDNF